MQLIRYFAYQPCSKKRLSERPSLEVQITFTVFPEFSAHDLSVESTSLGVYGPYSAWSEESSRLAGKPDELPGFPGSASGSQPAGYGAAHRFFQPLSDLFLSSPSHHFQMGDAHGVPPYKGLLLLRSPDDSTPSACPLAVIPVGCACSFLGKSTSGRGYRLPGELGNHHFSTSRL